MKLPTPDIENDPFVIEAKRCQEEYRRFKSGEPGAKNPYAIHPDGYPRSSGDPAGALNMFFWTIVAVLLVLAVIKLVS